MSCFSFGLSRHLGTTRFFWTSIEFCIIYHSHVSSVCVFSSLCPFCFTNWSHYTKFTRTLCSALGGEPVQRGERAQLVFFCKKRAKQCFPGYISEEQQVSLLSRMSLNQTVSIKSIIWKYKPKKWRETSIKVRVNEKWDSRFYTQIQEMSPAVSQSYRLSLPFQTRRLLNVSVKTEVYIVNSQKQTYIRT